MNKYHDATSARSRSLESGLDGGSNGHPDDDEDEDDDDRRVKRPLLF